MDTPTPIEPQPTGPAGPEPLTPGQLPTPEKSTLPPAASTPTNQPPAQPLVTNPLATPPASNQSSAAPKPAATPQIADDVDVIEKEWVDQAEKVIEEKSDDPHAEEEAFEFLQTDYLKKRYGKDIKQPDDR